jgi:hypothetical protein
VDGGPPPAMTVATMRRVNSLAPQGAIFDLALGQRR